MDEKREIRNTAYQVVSDEEKRTVEGYALLFGVSSDGLSFEEVIEHGINNKLYPERVAKVYPLPDSNVKRVMVELSGDQKDTVYEDIVIEKSRHNYSDEYIKLTKDFYLKM